MDLPGTMDKMLKVLLIVVTVSVLLSMVSLSGFSASGFIGSESVQDNTESFLFIFAVASISAMVLIAHKTLMVAKKL